MAAPIEQQREIVFRDINTDAESHTTVMDVAFDPTYQNVVGFFARSIMRDLRLVGGFDMLFGKIKEFIETELFDKPVAFEDLNVLRNLSEPEASRTLVETLKEGINALTVQDRGTTEIRDTIKLSRTRPYLVKDQAYTEHDLPDRVPQCRRQHRKLHPGFHRQAERGGTLDGLLRKSSLAKCRQNKTDENFRQSAARPQPMIKEDSSKPRAGRTWTTRPSGNGGARGGRVRGAVEPRWVLA